MSYTWPVKDGEKGWGYKPPVHHGIDIIPKKKGSKQKVLAAKKGQYLYPVGGICQGFDWKDDTGKRHRYCHVDYLLSKKTFNQGDTIAQMDIQGYIKPWWYTHLHWVVWVRGRTIDPMTLEFDTNKDRKVQTKELFKKIWKREPAKGELLVFYYRWVRENRTKNWIINNMRFWYEKVYPNGKLSLSGDRTWQRHKAKIINKYGNK